MLSVINVKKLGGNGAGVILRSFPKNPIFNPRATPYYFDGIL